MPFFFFNGYQKQIVGFFFQYLYSEAVSSSGKGNICFCSSVLGGVFTL